MSAYLKSESELPSLLRASMKLLASAPSAETKSRRYFPLTMSVWRQSDNEPAEIPIEEASWRTQVFKIQGFVYKRFLPSHPLSFIFWLSFHFSRGQNRKSRSLVFLGPKQHGNACYANYIEY